MFEWNPGAFRRAMAEKKMTHKDLADRLGVDRVAVTQWAGKRSPSVESLQKLAAEGFSVWQLFNTPPPLTPDEETIIELWGRTPESNRATFMAMARTLAGPERRTSINPPENIADHRRFRRINK